MLGPLMLSDPFGDPLREEDKSAFLTTTLLEFAGVQDKATFLVTYGANIWKSCMAKVQNITNGSKF